MWSSSVTEERETDGDGAYVCPHAEEVRALIGNLENGVAFQSVAVAALQTLHSVWSAEKRAVVEAISLAQGEKLCSMIHSAEETAAAISDALDAQGEHILNMAPDASVREEGDNSWWFALTETIQSIEDGTDRLLSLASGQPKGSPARRLSSVVVRLLRKQHHELLVEADAWIS
ncbi:MAG: hypothetical protein WD423_08290 [Rhodothermales bacterium]